MAETCPPALFYSTSVGLRYMQRSAVHSKFNRIGNAVLRAWPGSLVASARLLFSFIFPICHAIFRLKFRMLDLDSTHDWLLAIREAPRPGQLMPAGVKWPLVSCQRLGVRVDIELETSACPKPRSGLAT